MRIRYILITLTIILMGAYSLNAQSINQEFAQELQKKSSSINSIKCVFTQIRVASFLENPVKKDGIFYFKSPENILLSYNDGDHIIMTSDWFEMKNGVQINTTKISSNPILRNLKSILSACIIGDLSKLTKDFEMSVKRIATGWTVIMKPKRGRAASKVSQIVLNFERNNMSLSLLKMEEKSGDYTEYKFYDKQFNVTIDSRLFEIKK